MPDLSTVSLWPAVLLLTGSALVILVAGTRLAEVADHLADRTGMGEILAGGLRGRQHLAAGCDRFHEHGR